MNARAALVAVVALALAALCVRLGSWQLSRWQEKRHANAALRSALAAPPLPLRTLVAPPASLAGRRLIAEGSFDETRHVLLSDRWRKEQPGVELLTPLVLADGGTVLVDRGWVPAANGVEAAPNAFAQPGPSRVPGLLVPVPRGVRAPAWERLPGATPARWSVRALDADTLRARLPGVSAGWVLRALPDSSAPSPPLREAPEPADDGMHLSYAVQWFLFAAASLAGGAFVIVRGRARSAVAR